MFTILQAAAGAAAGAAIWQYVVPAIVSAAGLIGSGIINRKSQKDTNKYNLKANKQLQEQAYKQNLDMWNMQNFYNSPASQMARYKAAGINPNVLYGSSSEVSAGNSASVPELSYPAYQAKAPVFDFQSPMTQLLTAAQIGNLNAQAGEAVSKTGFYSSQQKRVEALLPLEVGKMEKEQANIEANTQSVLTTIDGLRLDNKKKEILMPYVTRQAEMDLTLNAARVGELEASKDLKRQEIKTVEKQAQKYDAEIKVLGEQALEIYRKRTELYDSIIALNNSNKELNDDMASKYAMEASILKKELDNWELEFNARLNKMKSEFGWNTAQMEYMTKRTQNYVWETYVMPGAKTALAAGAYLASKGVKNPATFKGWSPSTTMNVTPM